MKMKKIALTLAAAVALFGCQTIKTPDGTIPDQYLSQAKVLEGTYSGDFEGRGGDLVVQFQGNRPVVTFHAADGSQDLLMPRCESSIGQITSVDTMDKDGKAYVSGANFVFDPNHCPFMVQSNKMHFSISQRSGKISIRASILERTEQRQVCRIDTIVDRYGHPIPVQHCSLETEYIYLTGRFSRHL